MSELRQKKMLAMEERLQADICKRFDEKFNECTELRGMLVLTVINLDKGMSKSIQKLQSRVIKELLRKYT